MGDTGVRGVFPSNGGPDAAPLGLSMIDLRRDDDDRRREAAAHWVVRLQAADLDESEALAFDGWLEAAAENGRAFDEALAVAQAYERHAGEVREGLAARRPRALPGRRAFLAAGGMAAAAALALVVLPQLGSGPDTEAFVTAKASGGRSSWRTAPSSTSMRAPAFPSPSRAMAGG